jgi:hypothetical protein
MDNKRIGIPRIGDKSGIRQQSEKGKQIILFIRRQPEIDRPV